MTQGCTDPGGHVNLVLPNTCGSSECNLLFVILLANRFSRWLLHLCKICAPLFYGSLGPIRQRFPAHSYVPLHEDVWGVEKDIHAFLTSAVHGGKWSPLTPGKTATLYPPDRTMGEAVSRSRRRRWKEKFHNSKLDLSAHRQPLYLQNYRGFNLKKKVPFHSTNGFSETERPFKLESLCTWLLSARSALNARI